MQKEAGRLDANLDYLTSLCDKCELETVLKTDVVPTRNDVWPRFDECDYKPGVRTVLQHHKEVKHEQYSTLI